MTSAEVTTILRQFNEWQRGCNAVLRPSSIKISEAIGAAVEMIDRLEAAEKSDAESLTMYRKARDERDALRAKIEAAERERDECNRRRLEAADHFAAQTALMKEKYDDLRAKIEATEQQEPVFWYRKRSDGAYEGPIHNSSIEETRKQAGARSPLYALPGAKAQPAPSIRPAALFPVIAWLRNGCDPLKAADELDLLAAASEAKP